MKKALFVLIFSLFIFPFIISAQAYNPLQTGDVKQQVDVEVSPLYPKANEVVNISVSAYGTNLNASNISWSVNEKVEKSEIGATKFSINAGNYGETKNIVITMQPVGQPSIIKKVTIAPQEVVLIYEADSYTPPFYKGKGLFNQEGTVRFVALPNMTASNGTRLNPNNLIYKWIINDTVQGSMSGYGRNSFVYKSGILGGKVKVEVEVSSTDGKTKGRGLMISSPQDSEVLIYEKNPLFGVLYNKELSYTDFRLQDKEITLKTEPFSLSTTNGSGLTYRWSINGGTIPVPENQNYVTLRNSTGQQGTSLINVLVNNPTHILQRTSKSIPINF